MAKKTKKIPVHPEKKKKSAVTTKYYRATYRKKDGTTEEEVYISDSLQSAFNYATGPNAYGRTLERLLEYDDLIDALI